MHFAERKRPKVKLRILPKHLSNGEFERSSTLHPLWRLNCSLVEQGKARRVAWRWRATQARSRSTSPASTSAVASTAELVDFRLFQRNEVCHATRNTTYAVL